VSKVIANVVPTSGYPFAKCFFKCTFTPNPLSYVCLQHHDFWPTMLEYPNSVGQPGPMKHGTAIWQVVIACSRYLPPKMEERAQQYSGKVFAITVMVCVASPPNRVVIC
jgi:hypothetical protein